MSEPATGMGPEERAGAATAANADAVPTHPGGLSSAYADEPINILIVDDEPKNLTVLETLLDSPDYRLVRAESADQALLALVAEEFALLILDIHMPGMTGFELAQTIKGRKKTSRVPIIFLTAYYNEDEHALEGYGSGAVDYLHKPINAAILRSKVAVFAELHRKSQEALISNRALLAEVMERRRAEQKLHELNESLDRLVIERTHSLQQLEAELRDASRRKDEFIATLAHELRNPLAPVRSAVRVLQLQGGDTAESQPAKQIIARQIGVMARLIDDLMDVSRINQGRIELQREIVDLATVLELAVEATRPHMEESGHELALVLPDAPVVLHADVTRLSQIFVNLLTNAAKYTDQGGRIELAARHDDGAVKVTVRDNGIGIAEENLRSLFVMFAQVEGALSRSRGGLGIGLSLVKHLAELHGGSVEAHSPGLGAGSTFTVSLPLAELALSARPLPAKVITDDAHAQPDGELRILVVDDNQDGAQAINDLLKLLGHDVRMVHDGEAAVRVATEFRPDLMLLDIGLPILTGYEVCRLIRQQPWSVDLTVVAMTGWGDPEAQRQAKAVGFDRHLVKPLDETLLMDALASAKRSRAPS
jgi:signal transduction histidine kinase